MNNVSARAVWATLLSFIVVGAIVVGAAYLSRGAIPEQLPHAAFDGQLPPEPITLYTARWNLYQTIFKEPFETTIFLFKDGEILSFSTQEGGRVGAPISVIIDSIKASGKNVRDCLLIAHNHFTPIGFTPADKYTLGYLRERGFAGEFGIYYTATGKFVAIDK